MVTCTGRHELLHRPRRRAALYGRRLPPRRARQGNICGIILEALGITPTYNPQLRLNFICMHVCMCFLLSPQMFCAGHGGGKRCSMTDCLRSAVGKAGFCTAHGGGQKGVE
jgi:hypothetical protein